MLERPSPDLVNEILADLTEWFLGENVKEVRARLDQLAMERENQPETLTQSDAFAVMGMLRYYTRLMRLCGIEDFSIMDILKPDSTRFRRQLSAVVAFARFREDRFQDFADAVQNCRQQSEELRKMEDNSEDLATKIEAQEAFIRENVERAREILDENSEMEGKLRALKLQQEELTHRHGEYKKQKQQLAKKLEEQTLLYQEVERENQSLRPYADESVATRRDIVSKLDSTVKEHKLQLESLEQKQRKLLLALETVRTNQAELAHCASILQECERDLDRQKEAQAKLTMTQDQLSTKQQELDLRQSDVDSLKQQIMQIEERTRRATQTESDMSSDSSDKAIELRNRREMVQKQEANAIKQQQEKQRSIRSIEQEISSARTQLEQQVAATTSLCKEAMFYVNAYMENLELAIDGRLAK